MIKDMEKDATSYIYGITNSYLKHIGGSLNAENMNKLTANQHTLLAYRIILDEVMEGGFIQLIQNGYGPYVLDGPFAKVMKQEWNLRDFGNFMYDVKREYNRNREQLEADLTEEEFMALYEQQEAMNELGDDFLDEYQETVTPAIAAYVKAHEQSFLLQ